MKKPPQVELMPDAAVHTTLNVDVPLRPNLSAEEDANHALEEKTHKTVRIEDSCLEDIHNELHGASHNTPGNQKNHNLEDVLRSATSQPKPSSPKQAANDLGKPRSKRSRTDSPSGSDPATSKTPEKKLKLDQQPKESPKLNSSKTKLKSMLVEFKSEILNSVMKLNTPQNHTLDVRLKSLEEKLDKVDFMLRKVLAAVASEPSREPTPANFQQMDTDDNISSIEPEILKKAQPTSSCGIRPSAIYQDQLHTTNPSPKAPHSSNNLHELSDPRLRAPKNNTEIKSQRLPNSEDNIRSIEEPAHFDYIEREFKRTFGLPTNSGKKCTISSYDGVVLAVGYSKVVITWQGMYFRLKAEDIKFGNLRREDNPNSNVVT